MHLKKSFKGDHIMNKRQEKALEKRKKGYNCAQAVACVFCDEVNLDEELLFKLTEGFGGGMGSMEGTCGAVTAACLLAGLVSSSGHIDKPDSKALTSRLSKEILTQFKQRNQTVTCKVLKGIETGKVLRSCPDCICDAIELTESIVFHK